MEWSHLRDANNHGELRGELNELNDADEFDYRRELQRGLRQAQKKGNKELANKIQQRLDEFEKERAQTIQNRTSKKLKRFHFLQKGRPQIMVPDNLKGQAREDYINNQRKLYDSIERKYGIKQK